MNRIQESMNKIQASEELKKNTLQYLEKQQKEQSPRRGFRIRFVLAACCILAFLLGIGGYSVYIKPVSYISIDVNPSIELGINRFEKVVSVVAYNQDGQDILQYLSLKNISYIQAIDKLLQEESYDKFLTEDSLLIFTVISDRSDTIIEKINTNQDLWLYDALTYTSDKTCMEEAHQHEMSFGKYRVYIELSQYDESITVEDCHGMTIGEMQDRIETCRHEGTENREENQESYQEHHEKHHKNKH